MRKEIEAVVGEDGAKMKQAENKGDVDPAELRDAEYGNTRVALRRMETGTASIAGTQSDEPSDTRGGSGMERWYRRGIA